MVDFTNKNYYQIFSERAAEHPDKVEELKAIMVREHVPNHLFPLFKGE